MADTARAQKIADRIKTLTAENLESIVKDPDLGFVTITDVRVTGDLQHASLFYTVFGDAGQRAQTARLLELNKGKLRSFVGKQLGIRLTPSLEFIADAIPETAAHLEDLLREARERDAAVAAAAAGAVHAGDADPYKKDREDEATRSRVTRRRVTPTPDGILVVDKPPGWTSHDVVARARRLCATRKVGHAGTLDPMATGVLVLGVGRATRLLTFLVGCDKDYTATIRLGQATLTDDAEGEVTASAGAAGIERGCRGRPRRWRSPATSSRCRARSARSRSRASGPTTGCAAARASSSPPGRSRCRGSSSARRAPVDVDGIPVLDVDVEVTVSSGTYVRALARDLGAALRLRRAPDRVAAHPGRRVRHRRRPPARRPRGPTGRADAGHAARRRRPRGLRRA